MAAIWGVVKRQGSVTEPLVRNMKGSMEKFRIDRFDSIVQEKLYFACGHQYFTSEAQKDVSPYYDDTSDVYFNADCFLINREDLIQELEQHGTVGMFTE